MENIMDKLIGIYTWLEDEESKELFQKRIQHVFTSGNEFCDWILDRYDDFYCTELNKYEKEHENITGYVIFGVGCEGRQVKKILEACNRQYPLGVIITVHCGIHKSTGLK